MTTSGIRIKKIRTILGFTQEKFGNIFGFSKSFVSALENDKNNLSYENLVKLLLDYDVNINYLLAGIGEPFLTEKSEESEGFTAEEIKKLKKLAKGL